MAKELPYFKFEPNEWINGNIQMASPIEKAYFIELCCLYWSRLGDVPVELAIRKSCEGNATAFNSLKDLSIFRVAENRIEINFLDVQMAEFFSVSKQNSENAKIRWAEIKRLKELTDATAMRPHSDRNANRIEENRREERKKELLSVFWNLYGKKEGLKKVTDKWMKLPIETMEIIIQRVPAYIQSTPDLKFRKQPLTYLNGEHWNDEVLNASIGANGEVKKKYRVSTMGNHTFHHWTDQEHRDWIAAHNQTNFHNVKCLEE
jgi:hypothetical protein